jgi:hypothetical protein
VQDVSHRSGWRCGAGPASLAAQLAAEISTKAVVYA